MRERVFCLELPLWCEANCLLETGVGGARDKPATLEMVVTDIRIHNIARTWIGIGNGRHVANELRGVAQYASLEFMAFSDAGSSRSGYDCDAAAPLPPQSIRCPICATLTS